MTRTNDTPQNNTPRDKAKDISAMFGRIVRWYDPLNRILSMGLDQGWRQCLARTALCGLDNTIAPRVLDLAAGTLDVSLALHKLRPDATVAAMDYCLPMLAHGRKKLKTIPLQQSILLAAADGRRLPLADGTVNAVTIAFGIRNITPRQTAMQEMHRVLKNGGRVCILEFGSGRQRIWKGLYNFYLKHLLPVAGKLFSGDNGAYEYLARTICEFPTADELADELRAAGFARVYHIPLTSGIVCLHVAEKNDPA